MTTTDPSRARRAIVLLLFGVLVAACSPAAPSVAPSAPQSAIPESVAPTAVATTTPIASPAPVATASAAAAPDPAIGLKIAAPYTLTPLAPVLETTLRQQFTGSAGAFASLIGFGGRTITAGGAPAGMLFVMGLPTGVLTDATYQSILAGMASNSGVTFKTTAIAGTDVSSGTGPTGTVGVFRGGDRVIILITPKEADLPVVAKSLIDANK